jgi:hypothetical protein
MIFSKDFGQKVWCSERAKADRQQSALAGVCPLRALDCFIRLAWEPLRFFEQDMARVQELDLFLGGAASSGRKCRQTMVTGGPISLRAERWDFGKEIYASDCFPLV